MELDDSDGGAPMLDLCDVCDGMGRRRAGQFCTYCNGSGNVPRLKTPDKGKHHNDRTGVKQCRL